VTPAATVLAALAFWPLWVRQPGLALSTTLLFAALLSIGVVLLAEPGQLLAGGAMIASSILLVVSWVNEWGGGPYPLLSRSFGDLWILLAGWVLYRYPDRSMHSWERVLFGSMFVWLLGIPWLKVALSQPEWHQFPPDAWWPSLNSDETLYTAVAHSLDLATTCFAVAYIAAWVHKLRGASRVERKIKIANSIAAVAAASVGVLIPVARALDVPEPTMDLLYTINGAAVLAVPIALLIAIVRRQLARTGLTSLLPQLVRSTTTGEVVGALRAALADPELDVLPWSDDAGAYVDRDRRELPPGALVGRAATPVATPEGRRLALVVTDPALHTDPELIEAASAAVSLALENTLLIETVQRQLDELQQASQRVVKAGGGDHPGVRAFHDPASGSAAGRTATRDHSGDRVLRDLRGGGQCDQARGGHQDHRSGIHRRRNADRGGGR